METLLYRPEPQNSTPSNVVAISTTEAPKHPRVRVRAWNSSASNSYRYIITHDFLNAVYERSVYEATFIPGSRSSAPSASESIVRPLKIGLALILAGGTSTLASLALPWAGLISFATISTAAGCFITAGVVESARRGR